MSLNDGNTLVKGIRQKPNNTPSPTVTPSPVAPAQKKKKTPYQLNVSEPVQTPETTVGIPGTQEIYAQIWKVGQTDPEKAKQLTKDFIAMQSDPASPFYQPYKTATNRSVQALNALGVDTSNIDDNWFQQTADLEQYLRYDGTTNAPSKPGKKASDAEKAAYERYQIGKANDLTKSAQSEWAALQEEIDYWTRSSGRNYSDDEIMDKIYGKNGNKLAKKYPTLAKMDASLQTGKDILELNTGIGYSRDNVRTAIWRSRNDGGTGDWDMDALLMATGQYNGYVEDPDIVARRTDGSEYYAPYSLGSTMDEACVYYGQNSFTTEEIANMKPDGSDATEAKMWNSLYEADQFTIKAEDELAEFNAKLDKKLETATDPEKVMKDVDRWLGDKYKSLKSLDDTAAKVNSLKDTTRAIDYSYNDVLRKVQAKCAENKAQPAPVEKVAQSVAEPVREGEQAPATPALTPEDIETAKVKDQNIQDGYEIGEGNFTPAEEAVMKNAGSSMWDYMRGMYTDAMDRMDAGRQMVQNNIDNTSKGYVQTYLQDARTVANYNTVSDNYAVDSAELMELQQKYGNLEDYYDDLLDHKTVQLGDGTSVYMHLDSDSNSYILDSIGMLTPEELDLYDEGSPEKEMLREAERIVQHETDRIPGIKMAHNMKIWGGEKFEKELQRYGQVNVRVENEKRYLKEHDAEYGESQKALDAAEQEMSIIGLASAFLGADTTGLENARAMSEYLLGFVDEPPLPRNNETKLQSIYGMFEMAGVDATNEEVSNVIAEGKQKIQDEMKLIEDMLAYADETGIEIPDNVRKNMQFMMEDYQKEMQGFDYASILVDVDPAEVDKTVEAGRAFEEKYGEGNMHYWTELFQENGDFYTLKYQQRYTDPEGETYRDIVTEEDEKTYYYLLGKKVLEMGASLDDAIGRINVDPEGARAAVRDAFSEAKEYQRFMEDEVWSVREYDASIAFGEQIAEEAPVLANLAATLVTPGESIASALEIIDTAVSGRRFNSKSMAARFTGVKNVVRAQTREDINNYFGENTFAGKIANIGYEIYCNRGDSMMNNLAFGWMFGGVGGMTEEFLGAAPMGATAALSAAAEAIENGASTEQAWLIAGATFLAETVTESVTLSNIQEAFGTGKELTQESIKGFIKEWLTKDGLEEVGGEVLNNIVERAASRWAARMDPEGSYASDHQRLVDQYIAQGKGPEEAEALARADELKDDLHTAIVSYLSEGTDVFIKTGKATVNSANYYRTATRAAQQLGDSRSMLRHMLDDYHANKEARQNAVAEPANRTVVTTNNQAETGFETEDVDLEFPVAQQETADVEPAVAAEQQAHQEAETAQKTAYAKDLEVLTSAMNTGATESATAGISAILAMDKSDASIDQANAASVRAGDVFSGGIGEMRNILAGGGKANVDNTAVKVGMMQAILGGENSASYQLVQSEEFQNATDEQKAQMLAETGAIDAQDQNVQQTVNQTVQETRIAENTRNAISDGMLNGAKEAKANAERAADEARQAQEDLTVRQSETQAADDARVAATQNAVQNPGDLNALKAKQSAEANMRSKVEVEQEYEQRLQKAEEKRTEAERKAKAQFDQDMATIRGQSQETVAQTDQQRAEAAAQEAEAQRIADEQQAQAQAEEDQRSGKADEDKTRQIAENLADEMGLEGEERETLVNRFLNRQEQRSLPKINLNGKVTNAEGFLAIGAFSRKTGMEFKISDTLPNGKPFRPGIRGAYANGTVYLNASMVRSGEMTLGQALVEASLHEITHSMENTRSYQKYKNTVLDIIYGHGEDRNFAKMDADIDQRIKTYKGLDTLDREGAIKEIVADFARERMADKDTVQRFMDAGLGGKMRNALHNINQALKNFFGNMTGEERRIAESYRKAERLYQKALDQVARTEVHPDGGQYSIMQVAQATGMTFDEEKLELRDKDGNVIDGVKRKLKPDDIVKTPAGFLIRSGLDLFDGENAKQAKKDAGYIDPTSTAGKALDMMTGLMNMIARYKQSDLVWEIGASTLSSTFSALKSNSDTQYQTTVDFGTICAKTQAIIDVMSQVMMDKIDPETGMLKEGMKAGLTRKEIMKVYDATHNANLSVPCPVCYVFSRWMGVPSLLGQMSQFQKDYVVTKKDENGKPVVDKKGRVVIDWAATKKVVDDYLFSTEKGKEGMLVRYKDKDAINDKKTKLQNRMKTLEEKRNTLEKQLADPSLSEEEKTKIQDNIESALSDMVDIEDQLGEVRAFNWVTQALCLQKRKGNSAVNVTDKDGHYVLDEKNFQLTPDSILFDLNRTSEFAEYAKNWSFRNTRGAGMGKSIMPYSGETIGDMFYNGKGKRQNGLKNPWLNYVEGGKNGQALRQLNDARKRAKQQNLLGGQRLQSTSDFRPEWGLDYIMSFLELQAAGSKVQMYTKVAEAVDFFASVGADVNLSIMGQGTGWHLATEEELSKLSDAERAVREVKLGDKTYLMDFSPITGMKYFSNDVTEKTATSLKNMHDNVQMILVGMNDTHIRLAMANSNIDFIIPWHSSGNSKEVLANLISSVGEKLNTSVDYTTTQSDMKKGETKSYYDENGEKVEYSAPGEQTEAEKHIWDLRMRILTGKADNDASKGGFTAEEREEVYKDPWLRQLYDRFYVKGVDDSCYHVKLSGKQAGQIFPYEYWATGLVFNEETGEYTRDPNQVGATKETADENGKRFVEYCERMGIIPRFSQFKDDPGYWKLLIDRPMYNNDGSYHEQQTINVTNARVGALNEKTGKLDKSTTDLPTQAQAVYAPKDKRSPMYNEYRQREENAIAASEKALGIPYTEKQEAAMQDADAIQDDMYRDGVDQQLSVYGGMTDADIDQMLAQASEDYDSAVARNDMATAEEINEFFASQRGFDTENKAYHGTDFFGFTEFDLEEGQGTIFVAYDKDLAATYSRADDTKAIYNANLDTADDQTLIDLFKGANEKSGQEIADVTVNEDGDFVVDFGDGTETYSREEIIDGLKNFDLDYAVQTGNMNAESYVADRLREGIYGLYTRPGNQLVIDGEGKPYGETPVPWSDKPMTTREIAEYAKANGYDSVRINNIVDRGHHWDKMALEGRDIGIFFNENDVKSADPITKDNNGNVINPMNRYTDEKDLRYSAGGEMTDADIDQMLAENGLAPQLSTDQNGELPGMPAGNGRAQRQYGHKTAQGSDAIHQEVKDYLYTHSDYDPETNQEQIGRAMDWVRSNASEGDEDGYRASLDEVLSPGFDYRSADGQARMLTVMGMAALKAESGDRSALNDELRLNDAYNKQGTDIGRQLQARKIFRLMTPLGRRQALLNEVNRINTDFANRGKDTQVHLSDWTMKAAESAQTEQDFEKVQKAAEAELASQIPANWKEKLQTWRMLSMLGNPRTHIRNVVGNAIFVPTVGLKNAIATVLENKYIKEGERTKAVRYTDDAKAFAKQDVEAMKDVLTGEAKYSPENRIDRQKKAFGQKDGILSRTVGRFVQGASDFNSFLLEAEDWVFLNKHYQNALASYMTANGLTSENMTGKTLEKAREYAVLEAQKATYRDANEISDSLNKISRGGGVKGFLLDTVLPFKKTPANILRRGIEYSPVGLVKSFATAKRSVDLYNSWASNGFKGDMPKGAKTMNQALDSIAAGMTGTMISALGMLGYALGAVKLGFGKEDDDELEQERGSQEYSIELFGQSLTIDWAAPVCMPFFLGASLWQNIAENNGDITLGSVVNAVMGISEPVFNLSMLDGVNSLLETAKYSTNKNSLPIGDLLQKIGANYVGSMFPALGGAWARTIDNTRRKNFIQSGDELSIWSGMLEQAQNKIPGLSFLNIPYRNVWGEADVTPRGEAFLENFVLPGYINHMKEDKLVNELQRIYDQTKNKSVIPTAAGKTVGGIRLTDKQYDKYVVTRGQTAKQLLNELIERPEFIALTPTDVSAGNPAAQIQLIGEVWKYANAVARYEVDPEYDIGKNGKWIAGAYARGDVIDTIFANEEAKAQAENANAANADLITAINGEDADAIGASVEALKRAGKTDEQIRTSVMNGFRDMYKEAYRTEDTVTMERIETGMQVMDLGEKSFTDPEEDDSSIFNKWKKDVDKESDQ